MAAFDPVERADGAAIFGGAPPCAALREALLDCDLRHQRTYYVQFDNTRSQRVGALLARCRGRTGTAVAYVSRPFGGRDAEILYWSIYDDGAALRLDTIQALLGRPVCGGEATKLKNPHFLNPDYAVVRRMMELGTRKEAGRLAELVKDEIKLQRQQVEGTERKIVEVEDGLRLAKRNRWVRPSSAERADWETRLVAARQEHARWRNQHLALVQHVDRERSRMIGMLSSARKVDPSGGCLRAAKWGLGY